MTIDFASDVPDSRARRVWRVHSGCSKTLKWGDMADHLPEVIREAIEIRAWESIVPRKTGKPFPSLLAWLMNSKSQQGTSKAYTVERLSREAPALFRAVCDGEMSANAAAIQAGIRKKPRRGLAAIKKDILALSDRDRGALVAWIKSEKIR